MILCALTVVSAQEKTTPVVGVTYEIARDRYHYRFENPSTFDTPVLVPHEFTQRYWADNQWLVVQATYRLGRRHLHTELAATPQRTARGEDIDTFYLPDGDVAVSGTSGNVSLHAFRVQQSIDLGRSAGLAWRVGYQFRRDRNEFASTHLKTVRHTRPPSVDTFVIPSRETTISETHEVQLGASRRWTPTPAWRVAVDVEMSPTTRARLTTRLPVKYPGRDIVFSALVMSVSPRLTASYGKRWPLTFVVGGTRTLSYTRTGQFTRSMLSAGVGVGRRF